jgi:hypothetical protein
MKLAATAITSLLTLAPAVAPAQQCPNDALISTVLAPGFSCMLGDKTFSAFAITGAPTDARIQFGILNNVLFAVTLSRDGAFFPDGRLVFDYTITPTAPLTIREGSVGIDVSFPLVITTTTMNSTLLGPLTNGATETTVFTPGVTSVVVDNTSTISGPAELNSISNDFSQQVIGVMEFGHWLGPTSLLMAGIAGVWILRRRK